MGCGIGATTALELPGMNDLLLATLAATNPTLLQLCLLRSTEAVCQFLGQETTSDVSASASSIASRVNSIGELFVRVAPQMAGGQRPAAPRLPPALPWWTATPRGFAWNARWAP
jgi:hypothetical protein